MKDDPQAETKAATLGVGSEVMVKWRFGKRRDRRALIVGQSRRGHAWRVQWLTWTGLGRKPSHGLTRVNVSKEWCKAAPESDS